MPSGLAQRLQFYKFGSAGREGSIRDCRIAQAAFDLTIVKKS